MCWFEDIDEEVKKLKEKKAEVPYCQHYGGGWKVSVTPDIWCVDLRRFYLNDNGEEKPTRHGIGLRLYEWEMLKNIVDRLGDDHPDLRKHNTCKHDNVDQWLDCHECMPFIQGPTKK